jgi:hypothetical protein
MRVWFSPPHATLLLLGFLCIAVPGVAQTTPFWEKVLRIIGVSATPGALKGPGDRAAAGDIWVASLVYATRQRLTQEGTYRSPVFLWQDTQILALQAEQIVRIPAYGGEVQFLYPLPGVVKLVGVSKDDPDKVLVLMRDATSRLTAGILSLRDGQITPVPHASSPQDQSMLDHLAGWSRVYNTTTLSVEQAAEAGQGTDVYMKRGQTEPVNVSMCDGPLCSQPSLSHDGNRVVFVKTAGK